MDRVLERTGDGSDCEGCWFRIQADNDGWYMVEVTASCCECVRACVRACKAGDGEICCSFRVMGPGGLFTVHEFVAEGLSIQYLRS